MQLLSFNMSLACQCPPRAPVMQTIIQGRQGADGILLPWPVTTCDFLHSIHPIELALEDELLLTPSL